MDRTKKHLELHSLMGWITMVVLTNLLYSKKCYIYQNGNLIFSVYRNTTLYNNWFGLTNIV